MADRHGRLLAVGAMVLAVMLFSAVAAAVAGMAVTAGASLSLTALGSGVTLAVWAACTGESLRGVWQWPVLLIGALGLSQAALYFFALRLAPVGPAAALHLSAPVILLLVALARRARRVDGRAAATLGLLIVGLVGAALVARPEAGGQRTQAQTMLGLALALGSAGLFAAMISAIHRYAAAIPLVTSNAARSLSCGVLCLPLVVTAPPSVPDTLGMLTVGALLLGPGMGLAWFALSRVSPQITSTIDLGEAGVTPVLGHMVWGTALGVGQLAVIVPVIAAVWLQVTAPAVTADTQGEAVPAGPRPGELPVAAPPATAVA